MVKMRLKKLVSVIMTASLVMAATIMPVNAGNTVNASTQETTLIKTDLKTGEETIVEVPEVPKSRMAGDVNSSSYFPGLNSRSVIGDDHRQEIANTTAHPYYAIAYLSVSFSNGNTYRGTGYMIGKNVMLTAGHVLYETGYNVTNITAYFGRSGDYKPLTATGSGFYLDTKYTGSEADWDYGIITFDEDIGNTTGWFGIHANDGTDTIGSSTITVTGYPADLGDKMYTDIGTVSSITEYRFSHDADTYGGNSGSPVYFYSSTYGYQAVGIHTHSGNSGRRITMSLFDWLEEQGFI